MCIHVFSSSCPICFFSSSFINSILDEYITTNSFSLKQHSGQDSILNTNPEYIEMRKQWRRKLQQQQQQQQQAPPEGVVVLVRIMDQKTVLF
jgi:hypothetical protein